MRLEGRSVLLTGATGGIGSAIAHELAARGCAITVTGPRQVELERLIRASKYAANGVKNTGSSSSSSTRDNSSGNLNNSGGSTASQSDT